jgi:hypothetical protein
MGPLGSRDAMLTVYRSEGELYAGTGCYIGPIEDFKKRVVEVHKDSIHAQRYLAAVAFAMAIFK